MPFTLTVDCGPFVLVLAHAPTDPDLYPGPGPGDGGDANTQDLPDLGPLPEPAGEPGPGDDDGG